MQTAESVSLYVRPGRGADPAAAQPATAAPNPGKALWEKGDFTRIAGAMRFSIHAC